MRAITRPLSEFTDADLDLNDFARGDGYLFVRDGVGCAGRGIAVRVNSHDAVEFLQTIEHDSTIDGPGVGPILMGCIPFNSADFHQFILPRVIVGKGRDGNRWLTTIDGSIPDLDVPARPVATSSKYTIAPGIDIRHYLEAVAAARDAVKAGRLTKAVIARDVIVTSTSPIDVHAVLLRLRASFGSSYRYSFDGFIGASPELLVAVHGTEITSHPLAGTAPRTGDPETDSRLAHLLMRSEKNQIEHRVVINMVHDTLLPWCSYLDWEPEPSIVAVANVQHLGTLMKGQLSQPAPSVLDLAYLLAPTPALGGHPRDEALQLIAEVEGIQRGRYGGAIGWVDAMGNGTWAVAIRCAELSADAHSARLFAGGGIVADSEPHSELAETQAKFQAMLAALIRP
ncbi:MAG: isochorismate synthase [Ilumatobacteraceae bacterium]